MTQINHLRTQYQIAHVQFTSFIGINFISISVIDCLLSEWGPWSECDAKCGTGTRSRTRSILRAPENGGKHCASLTQKQGCEGYRCKSYHERKALSGNLFTSLTQANNHVLTKASLVVFSTLIENKKIKFVRKKNKLREKF